MTEEEEQEKIQQLENFMDAVGPRRVKTKDIDIESHPLRDVVKVLERRRTTLPTFGSLTFTKVEPKYGCYCPQSKEPRCSG